MVRVWVADKTVWSRCYTRAISERFRDKELIIKRYINSPSLLLLYFIHFGSYQCGKVKCGWTSSAKFRFKVLRDKAKTIALAVLYFTAL